MEKQNLNIIVVDDNKILLEGMKFYLEEIKSYNVINTSIDGEEFFELYIIYNANIV